MRETIKKTPGFFLTTLMRGAGVQTRNACTIKPDFLRIR